MLTNSPLSVCDFRSECLKGNQYKPGKHKSGKVERSESFEEKVVRRVAPGISLSTWSTLSHVVSMSSEPGE